MKTVGLTDPDNVVRESVAIFLFQRKLISLGKAAKLANTGLEQFMELLRTMNIPQTEYSQDDFLIDLKTIRKLKHGKRHD